MNTKRLLLLACKLDRVPEDHFDMANWVGTKSGKCKFPKATKNGPLEKELLSCGTCACAAGWACTIPSFNRDGLCIVGCTIGLVKSDRAIIGPDALEQFFEITYVSYVHLFGFEHKRTPAQEAAVIRAFVKSGGVIPQATQPASRPNHG